MHRFTPIASFVFALLFSVFALAQSAPQLEATQRIIPRAQGVLVQNGMVVAQESRAARIGAEILDRGGNAVDAAVATGFAMAVTYPRAGNIGGGGFMVIHLAKDATRTATSPSTIARPRRRATSETSSSTRRAMPTRRSRATPGSPSACRARSPGWRWRCRNTAPASSRSPT